MGRGEEGAELASKYIYGTRGHRNPIEGLGIRQPATRSVMEMKWLDEERGMKKGSLVTAMWFLTVWCLVVGEQ